MTAVWVVLTLVITQHQDGLTSIPTHKARACVSLYTQTKRQERQTIDETIGEGGEGMEETRM